MRKNPAGFSVALTCTGLVAGQAVGPGLTLRVQSSLFGPFLLDDVFIAQVGDGTGFVAGGTKLCGGVGNALVTIDHYQVPDPTATPRDPTHFAVAGAAVTIQLIFRHAAGGTFDTGFIAGMVWDGLNGLGWLLTKSPGYQTADDSALADILNAVRVLKTTPGQ